MVQQNCEEHWILNNLEYKVSFYYTRGVEKMKDEVLWGYLQMISN